MSNLIDDLSVLAKLGTGSRNDRHTAGDAADELAHLRKQNAKLVEACQSALNYIDRSHDGPGITTAQLFEELSAALADAEKGA